ncbi:MAG: hypothetical protein O2897_04475 [bacterium]|nr:hypothetical protein [bacterium]
MKISLFSLSLIILIASCSNQDLQSINKPNNYMKNIIPPKLEVTPQLGTAFDCVKLGCNQIKTIMLANRGGGKITIKKVLISPESSKDFTIIDSFKITPDTPIVLAALESLELNIRFQPSDGINDTGSLLVYWEDSSDLKVSSNVNLKEILLRTRVIGNKSVTSTFKELNFNYVKVSEHKTMFFPIENTSSGNAAITIKPSSPQSQINYFKVGIENPIHLNPGQKAQIPIVFTPNKENIFEEDVSFIIAGNNDSSLIVHCVGTSIATSQISIIEQKQTINQMEFGSVKEGNEVTRIIKIRNDGSTVETLNISLDNNELKSFHLSNANLLNSISLAPMETFDISIVASPQDGGVKKCILRIKDSNDNSLKEIPLTFYAISPLLEVSSTQIDLPNIATGWRGKTHHIQLSNSGTGELIINEISLDPQSSMQLELDNILELPIKLNPNDAPVSIGVKVIGNWPEETLGVLNIYSNSTKTPLTKILVKGSVVSCSEQCQMSHSEASCAEGTCAISTCEKGWHDADNNAKNGCECREDFTTSDIGNSCATGMQIGMLGDRCTEYEHEKTYQGTLHDVKDVDLFFVRTKDEGSLFCDIFGDSYKASVTLTSAPPGLVLCNNFQPFGTGCGGYRSNFDPNLCGKMHYEKEGAIGTNNSSDLTAWLMWHPDANPVCGEYTIVFRAQ